jgi:hypothetical protein
MKLFCPKYIYPLLLLMLCGACSEEDYSLNTDYVIDYCVVQGHGSQLCFLSDNGGLLNPSETLDSTLYLPDDRYRVTYVALSNNGDASAAGTTIRIVGTPQAVLVKDVTQSDLFYGDLNDQIWLVDDPQFGGGFLNFEFSFGYSDSNIKHGIYLIQDSLAQKKIYLTFGHQAYNDISSYTATALASFPLSSIVDLQKADSLIIHVLEGTSSVPKVKLYSLAVRDTL